MTLDIQSSGFTRFAGANGRELCGEFEYAKKAVETAQTNFAAAATQAVDAVTKATNTA